MDVNQETSVSLAEQYDIAGDSDDVINDNNAPDENVPAINNELQVRSATFTTTDGQHFEEAGKDTLLIRTIKSSSQTKTVLPLPNPFDVRST